MPETVTNELLYELLKDIQQRLDRHENMLKEIQAAQISASKGTNSTRDNSLKIDHSQYRSDPGRQESAVRRSDPGREAAKTRRSDPGRDGTSQGQSGGRTRDFNLR